MKALSQLETAKFLTLHLEEWSFEKNAIKRDFKFKTFIEAFSFMTAVALEAEKLNHHRDWSNSYGRVSITLTTHEADGLTQLDFDLANSIDRIYKNSLHTFQ